MAGKAIIVSPPSLDIIGEGYRAGGPSLYAGAALRLLGWEAYAVGPYGYCTSHVVALEEELGIHRLGYPVAGPGLVFRIEYTGEGRRVELLHGVPGLDPQMVLHSLEDTGRPDIVLVSPLYGEEPGFLPGLLSSRYMTLVDVQGYARRGLHALIPARGGYQVLHASRDEVEGVPRWGLVVLTDGPGRVEAYWNGARVHEYDPRGPLLDDPTGAGDAFTALVGAGLASGYTVEESVERAEEMVPLVLEFVHSLNRLEGVPC